MFHLEDVLRQVRVFVLADITQLFILFLPSNCQVLLVLVLPNIELVFFATVVSYCFLQRKHLHRLSCERIVVEVLEHLTLLIEELFWVKSENADVFALTVLVLCMLFNQIFLDHHV